MTCWPSTEIRVEPAVGLRLDRDGAEAGDDGTWPAVTAGAGLLAERAALLELVVVAATEGVADVGRRSSHDTRVAGSRRASSARPMSTPWAEAPLPATATCLPA